MLKLPEIPVMSEIRNFAEILLTGTHSIKAICAEFSDESAEPIVSLDLSELSDGQLRELDGSKLLPPTPIQRYLESGDILTNHAIDQMELAMEKSVKLKDPFFITSLRDGTEEKGNLSVRYFCLSIDPDLDGKKSEG